MKTLILNGSPKVNGDVAALVNEMTRHLHGEVRVLSHADGISPCVDCRHCWTHDGCCLDDALVEVYPFFNECDNVILASPIWFSELSGPLLNLASRFVQCNFAAQHFRGVIPNIRPKRSVLILCGAEPGTEKKAATTAHTILKFMNARNRAADIFSMDTNNIPAGEDAAAMNAAREAALLLNRLGGA